MLEIKCLKIFKTESVEDFIQKLEQKEISRELYNRQCFKVEDRKLVLKTVHAYYYQVQMQLMVTNIKFCDFVARSLSISYQSDLARPNHTARSLDSFVRISIPQCH